MMNVLCAVDGSPDSHVAIETLQGLGAGHGSTLELLYVIDIGGSGTWGGMKAFEIPEDRGSAIVEHVAHEYVASHWRTVRTTVIRGRPAEAILRAAQGERRDLVVVGSRGVTNNPAFLLGSVSRRVMLYAPCPVLVAKKSTATPRVAIVGMDGSEDARAAVEFLLTLPLAGDVRVIIATVIPPLPIPQALSREGAGNPDTSLSDSIEREAIRVAGQAVQRLREKGFDTMARVLHGQPGSTLVNLAESTRADLVVVGSHGLTGARQQFLMGSVSEAVTTYAPCSVLVYRTYATGPAGKSRTGDA